MPNHFVEVDLYIAMDGKYHWTIYEETDREWIGWAWGYADTAVEAFDAARARATQGNLL